MTCPRNSKDIIRNKSRICSGNVPGNFQGIKKTVRQNPEHVRKLCERKTWSFRDNFRYMSRAFPINVRDISATNPGLSGKFARTLRKQSWTFPGNSLKHSGNFPGNFSEQSGTLPGKFRGNSRKHMGITWEISWATRASRGVPCLSYYFQFS